MGNYYSSKSLMEEIKWRIRRQYHSQEKFANEFHISRKALSRILNHSRDLDTLILICKRLDIRGIILAE